MPPQETSPVRTVSIQEPLFHKQGRRRSEEDWIGYGQSMQQHTQKLLTKASRIAEIRGRISSLPHNSTPPPPTPIPTVSKVPHAHDRTPCSREFTRSAKPDPKVIENAINELNHMTIKGGGAAKPPSKTASIKTPYDPVAESKKKVLNRHGLRLTLDDRRPTVG